MSTFLLAWNPKRWQWSEIDILHAIARVQDGEKVVDRWSCGRTKKIQKGDRVFLIRLGEEPRGIFGAGVVIATPFYAPHWDPKLAKSGKHALFIEFYYDSLLNPHEEILSRDILKNDSRFSKMHWDTQMSGIEIPIEIADSLEMIWNDLIGPLNMFFPEEIPNSEPFFEGASIKVFVNKFERNIEARRKCIEHYGTNCTVCGFDFEKTYGAVGENFIHVHHLKSLSEIGERYVVDQFMTYGQSVLTVTQ